MLYLYIQPFLLKSFHPLRDGISSLIVPAKLFQWVDLFRRSEISDHNRVTQNTCENQNIRNGFFVLIFEVCYSVRETILTAYERVV